MRWVYHKRLWLTQLTGWLLLNELFHGLCPMPCGAVAATGLTFMDNPGLPTRHIVKKTFKLNIEGRQRDRVVEATKHDIRQYLKRERNKVLPAGADFWDFDCRFGLSEAVAAPMHPANITALIDAAVADGAESFYLELLAKPGLRAVKVKPVE